MESLVTSIEVKKEREDKKLIAKGQSMKNYEKKKNFRKVGVEIGPK